MKYFAINLGPIFRTFSLARKPREFWAVSYMFSYLMECILKTLDGENEKLELVSPAYSRNEHQYVGVGLFPDRAFYKVKQEIDTDGLLKESLKYFSERTEMDVNDARGFFSIMTASQEYESVSDAIKGLNRLLDIMELNQVAWEPKAYREMIGYLKKCQTKSPLYPLALNSNYFPIETLEEIAKCGAKQIEYSYQRYVCIVQADGDNMGKIVSSSQMEGKLNGFSSLLMSFAKNACQKINDFNALPIYAGGDDLLFIAPVCNASRKNILDLISEIDEEYKRIQDYVAELKVEVENQKKKMESIQTSLSYGISIIYCKYPLYEAWEIARNMQKIAKNEGRNSIVLNLRKNSGSDFQIVLSKSSEMPKKLYDLIRVTPNETLVSAVAHKIRANESIFTVFPKEESLLNERLTAFYEKVMDLDTKSENDSSYIQKTKEMLGRIYMDFYTRKKNKDTVENERDIETIISTLYSTLRIAKFIKGEEVKDE